MNRLEEAKAQLASAQAEWAAAKSRLGQIDASYQEANLAMIQAAQRVSDAKDRLEHEQKAAAIVAWVKADPGRARRVLSKKAAALSETERALLLSLGIMDRGVSGRASPRYVEPMRALAIQALDGEP